MKLDSKYFVYTGDTLGQRVWPDSASPCLCAHTFCLHMPAPHFPLRGQVLKIICDIHLLILKNGGSVKAREGRLCVLSFPCNAEAVGRGQLLGTTLQTHRRAVSSWK